MPKIAFLFPGQGSQAVGMGVELVERYPEALVLFEEAKRVLGWDLLEVCRTGSEDKLRQTDVAQPALYVTGFVAAAVLRSRGVCPDAVAGHSVGEYAALAAAHVFNFADGLALVRERSKLMKEAGKSKPGGMVAILGFSPEQAASVCQKASAEGVCVPVNFNSPEQIVIAGEQKAVQRAAVLAQEGGAKRVIPLNVAGAFHSPLMAEAATSMRALLDRVKFQTAAIPVAMNVDGALRSEGGALHQALARQLDSAVQWVKTIEALKAMGCTRFVECGSGKVLSGLLRRIDRQLEAFTTESVASLDATVNALTGVREETR